MKSNLPPQSRSLLCACVLGLCTVTACGSDDSPGKESPNLEGAPRLSTKVLDAEFWPSYPTDFQFLPGTQELLVLDKAGTVLHYALSEAEPPTLALLGKFVIPEVHAPLDCGLISIALDPGFANNHYFYLGYCTSGTASGVYRYEFKRDDYAAISATRREILNVEDPQATRPWHNVGWLDFAPSAEGNEQPLYVLFGDKVRDENAQETGNLLGAVARILPDRSDGGGHLPAPGNPGETDEAIHPASYAWGLRSPWRGGFDQYGHVVIGDVGLFNFEEVDVLDAPGRNFGWPEAEGPCVPRAAGEDDSDDEAVGSARCEELRDPASYFSHDSSDPFVKADPDATSATTRVVWVSSTYRGGEGDPYGGRMDDRLLFGDACTGFARSLKLRESGEAESDEPAGHLGPVSSVRQSSDGYLYGLRMAACTSEEDGQGAFVRIVPVGGTAAE